MRFGIRSRTSDTGLDGGEGRGVRLGGSDTAVPARSTRRRQVSDEIGEDTLVDAPQSPFEDYDEFVGENDATPDDRRRDPLRKSW